MPEISIIKFEISGISRFLALKIDLPFLALIINSLFTSKWMTPLVVACRQGWVDVVILLVNCGAQVDAKNYYRTWHKVIWGPKDGA